MLENFTVSSNSGAGVYLDNARQAKVANFTTSGNLDGVEINSGTGNIVQAATATSNTRYGFWLDSTTYNAIGGFEAEDNEMAGVYIGCSLTGPQGAKCPAKVKPSDYNSIFDGSAVNSAGVQAFGIAIDLGNSNNRVSGVMASFNSDQDDAVDDNPNCGDNIWIAITEGFDQPGLRLHPLKTLSVALSCYRRRDYRSGANMGGSRIVSNVRRAGTLDVSNCIENRHYRSRSTVRREPSWRLG